MIGRDRKEIGDAFAETLGADRVGRHVRLDTRTTFRTGGAADWLLETRSGREAARAVAVCHRLGLPVTLLGGGSNVLVGDRGVRGLVVRLRHGAIERAGPGVVRAGGGVTLNGLVRWTVSRGLAGLEGWAGTPGTVGGGLHGNAHFQGALLGERLVRAGLADTCGREVQVDAAELELGYDRSRLQRTGEVVLWADFAVAPGQPAALRRRACASLAFRKRTQPLAAPSAGCVFQNPDPARDHLPAGVPPFAGALLDRVGLKGAAVGGALVSRLHANFIVSDGRATASDVRRLIEACRAAVHERLGVMLRDEIVYLGEFEWAAGRGPGDPRPAGRERTA